MHNSVRYSITLGLVLAACGDDPKPNPQQPDANVPTPDAPIDGPPGYTPPMARKIPMSASGPDQMQSITVGKDGSFFIAGFFAADLDTTAVRAPRTLSVLKLAPNGAPVTAFGGADGKNDGFADIADVLVNGGVDEIDIATQPDGKIVISATTPTVNNDRDIVVVRLLPDTGALDTTFATTGFHVYDLNKNNGVVGTADTSRGLAVNDAGIFVHAVSFGLGTKPNGDPRIDTDYTVLKIKPNGEVDESFGDQSPTGKKGQFRLDIDFASATARAIKVLPDGKLLAGGYTNGTSIAPPMQNQPVIYKLTADGALDPEFAGGAGFIHEAFLDYQAEVYNFAIHGEGDSATFVTGGYGKKTMGDVTDYISLRFNLKTGERDLTWGGTSDGKVFFDPSGTHRGSNCRGAFALPDGKTMLLGSTGNANDKNQDAIFVVLDADGKLDTKYGTGINQYNFTAAAAGVEGDGGNDQFWAAAVSGTVALVVGWRGTGPTPAPSATYNDDAWGTLFTLK